MIGESELTINTINPEGPYDSGDLFNITLYFNDTMRDSGISHSEVFIYVSGNLYELEEKDWSDYNNGTYEIRLNCSKDAFFPSYGKFVITVNLTKNYYQNGTVSTSLKITGNTTLAIDEDALEDSYDSGDVFIITVYYNETARDQGISGATINYSLNGGKDYRGDNVEKVGGGYYNITVYANDSTFEQYGSFTIIINASKDNYYNQSEQLELTITGETNLSVITLFEGTEFTSGEIFNITLFFNDTARNQGITGATINYSLNGGASYRGDRVYPFGEGYYNITIFCNDTEFGEYGASTIVINGSKINFYNQSEELGIVITGEKGLTIKSPSQDERFDSGDVFNITIYFEDVSREEGIEGATINYSLNGGDLYRWDNVDEIGEGYYNITVFANDTQFGDYGSIDIIVNASKVNYENQSISLGINITGTTSLTIKTSTGTPEFDSGDIFNITLKYWDPSRNQGVENATINYSLNGGNTYHWENVEEIGGGYYNVTIHCNHSDFEDYGAITIILNASKAHYYNQSEELGISITGETSLRIIPPSDGAEFDSLDVFNFTIFVNDTARNQGLTGSIINYSLNGGDSYRWDKVYSLGEGFYNITVFANDTIFGEYGPFTIIINASKANHYNQSEQLEITITGSTSFTSITPAQDKEFVSGDIFNITVYFEDISRDIGIENAIINYSLDGGNSYRWDNITEIGGGHYNITIYANDSQFGEQYSDYGYRTILINISKAVYHEKQVNYTFHRQIPTSITSFNSTDLGSIIRGLNASYTFNYTDINENQVIGANYSVMGDNYNFEHNLQDHNNGSYTLHLDSDNVEAGIVYLFRFNISAIGNETQIISLTINVSIAPTAIENLTFIPEIARNSGLNQTITFYFNDTTNNKPVTGMDTTNIIVYDDLGGLWETGDFNWALIDNGYGNYSLNISLNGLDSGWYTLQINVSNLPNYGESYKNITFYLRGNYTQINMITMESPEGIDLGPFDENYSSYIGSDMFIRFNITDLENNNASVEGDPERYVVRFLNINDKSDNGTLSEDLDFTQDNNWYYGTISTSQIANNGTYQITLIVVRTNFENSTYSFNLTIQRKFETKIEIVDPPLEVTAGQSFQLIFRASVNNGTDWFPLEGVEISIVVRVNGEIHDSDTETTNDAGRAEFTITIPNDATSMNLDIELDENYNFNSTSLEIDDISVQSPPSSPPGINLRDLLPILIIIGAVAGIGISAGGVYRGVVVPRKQQRQQVLKEVRTIFDDAINLEHLLVLYKGMGACIYFKSMGSEKIDPDLISGFISAVSSFGQEIESQKSLNEMKYGDKTLLLSDGEYIRVAIVLNKKASLPLRRNLKRFVGRFEERYAESLPNWVGQLKLFSDAGSLVDEIFNTSITLPHRADYNASDIKSLETNLGKEMVKVIEEVLKESGRDFLFISKLLEKAREKTQRDVSELFMAIRELREKNLLIPIDISELEKRAVSDEERNQIKKKVEDLLDLSEEEKQKTVEELLNMTPEEREAYFTSLEEKKEIVSAPLKSVVDETIIENKKEAKIAIKKIKEKAEKEKKISNYKKAIQFYKQAGIIANDWDLKKLFLDLQEQVRLSNIEELELSKKEVLMKAEKAEKQEDYEDASKYYKQAADLASEIFKLGIDDMDKEVKDLTKKSKKLLKKSKNDD